jgi:hypothetical protein
MSFMARPRWLRAYEIRFDARPPAPAAALAGIDVAQSAVRGARHSPTPDAETSMNQAYLIMVVAGFVAFVLTLGVVWVRNYADDAKAARLKKGG